MCRQIVEHFPDAVPVCLAVPAQRQIGAAVRQDAVERTVDHFRQILRIDIAEIKAQRQVGLAVNQRPPQPIDSDPPTT